MWSDSRLCGWLSNCVSSPVEPWRPSCHQTEVRHGIYLLHQMTIYVTPIHSMYHLPACHSSIAFLMDVTIFYITWQCDIHIKLMIESPNSSLIFSSFCFLPPEYGLHGGNITFLEDCPVENLARYDTLPMIADQYRRYGVHPKVCCPQYISPQHICTPSDAWCPTYVVSLQQWLYILQKAIFISGGR